MQKVLLESFEDQTMAFAKPDEGFEKGFAVGFAEGKEAAKAVQTVLQDEFVQCISDLEFKYEEARSEITRSLGPLLSILVEKIFPHCLTEGFADQIVAVIQQSLNENTATGFRLTINPAQNTAVIAALAKAAIEVDLTVDPALPPNAAWVRYDQDELYVDGDALLGDIHSILTTVEPIEKRTETHG